MKRLLMLPVLFFVLSCSPSEDTTTSEPAYSHDSFQVITVKHESYHQGIKVLDVNETNTFSYDKQQKKLIWQSPDVTKGLFLESETETSLYFRDEGVLILLRLSADKDQVTIFKPEITSDFDYYLK